MPVVKKHPTGPTAISNTLNVPQATPRGPLSFAATSRAGSTTRARLPPGSQAPGRRNLYNIPSQGICGLDGISEEHENISMVQENTYAPSMAPMPKMTKSRYDSYDRSHATSFRTTGTRRTTRGAPSMARRNGRDWICTPECIRAPYGSADFKRGDVISVPFHVSNMNPHAKFTDTSLRVTDHGPVYTKRRMVVVLFKNKDGMFCLPLYSFGGIGITAKSRPIDLMGNYVCLRDLKHSNFKSGGPNLPVDFVHSNPYDRLSRETTIHLTGGMRVLWEEYIGMVGRLTREGHGRLLGQWKELQDKAAKESDDGVWPSEN